MNVSDLLHFLTKQAAVGQDTSGALCEFKTRFDTSSPLFTPKWDRFPEGDGFTTGPLVKLATSSWCCEHLVDNYHFMKGH